MDSSDCNRLLTALLGKIDEHGTDAMHCHNRNHKTRNAISNTTIGVRTDSSTLFAGQGNVDYAFIALR